MKVLVRWPGRRARYRHVNADTIDCRERVDEDGITVTITFRVQGWEDIRWR